MFVLYLYSVAPIFMHRKRDRRAIYSKLLSTVFGDTRAAKRAQLNVRDADPGIYRGIGRFHVRKIYRLHRRVVLYHAAIDRARKSLVVPYVNILYAHSARAPRNDSYLHGGRGAQRTRRKVRRKDFAVVQPSAHA